MKNKEQEQKPVKPTTAEEWKIWSGYKFVARAYGVDGKNGEEAHNLALGYWRADLQQKGVDPEKLEKDILDGKFSDSTKELLLHARWHSGEALTEEERKFHKSHTYLLP